jgi:tRNA (guanine-N7-)-methyltransferase
MSTRKENGPDFRPGERKLMVEFELGVPIAGEILPEDQWAKTAIKRLPESGRIDWPAVFGRQAELVLDIGCGNGRFLISSAVRRPDVDHIGIDILPVVIRYATRRGNQRGLKNTRFAVCDGATFLERYIEPESLSEIHLYHPQPVHIGDGKDRSLRILQPAFIGKVFQSLRPGGKFFLQTDSRPYWEYIQSIVPKLFNWREQTGSWPEDKNGRTRREIQAQGMGLEIYRAVAVKAESRGVEELERVLSGLPIPSFRSDRTKRRKRN